MRLAKAKFVELCGASLSSKAFKLIHSQKDRPPRATKPLGNTMILARESLTTVGQKNSDIGFLKGLFGLPCHLGQDAVFGNGLKAPRINHQVTAGAKTPLTEVPVSGKAGKIGHQGITRPRQPIKER